MAAHREFGIDRNVQECDLAWIIAVGIINDMDTLVLVVLKNIIAPGIDLTRGFGCSRSGDGNFVFLSCRRVQGYISLRIAASKIFAPGIATIQAKAKPY